MEPRCARPPARARLPASPLQTVRGGVLRVCAGGRPERLAPISFRPGDVRGSGGGPVATFEAGTDGRDAVDAGWVSPASEEAFLLGRGDAAAAGGCWVRRAPRVDLP